MTQSETKAVMTPVEKKNVATKDRSLKWADGHWTLQRIVRELAQWLTEISAILDEK